MCSCNIAQKSIQSSMLLLSTNVVSYGKILQALILVYHLIFQVPVNTQQKVAYAILARVNQVSFCEFCQLSWKNVIFIKTI